MRDYNFITLKGKVLSEPMGFNNGQRFECRFVLSVPRYNGENLLVGTDWVSIRGYGNLAQVCFDNLQDNDECLVEGCLKLIRKDSGEWETIVEAENMQLLTKKIA